MAKSRYRKASSKKNAEVDTSTSALGHNPFAGLAGFSVTASGLAPVESPSDTKDPIKTASQTKAAKQPKSAQTKQANQAKPGNQAKAGSQTLVTKQPKTENQAKPGNQAKPAKPGNQPKRNVSPAAKDSAFPGKLVLRREVKGRSGKTVTRISGIPEKDLAPLTKSMKKALGCGATVDGSDIVLLGSLVDRAAQWLTKAGADKIVKGN